MGICILGQLRCKSNEHGASVPIPIFLLYIFHISIFPSGHQRITDVVLGELEASLLKGSVLLHSQTLKGMSLVSFYYELGMSGTSSVLLVCRLSISQS